MYLHFPFARVTCNASFPFHVWFPLCIILFVVTHQLCCWDPSNGDENENATEMGHMELERNYQCVSNRTICVEIHVDRCGSRSIVC